MANNSKVDLRVYRAERRKGTRAKDALAIARHAATVRAFPFLYDGDTFETDDGFTAVVKVEWDEGDFGDTFGEFERCSYAETYPQKDGVRWDDRTVYIPSRHWDFSERLKYARLAGMARNVAYLAALRGIREEAETFERLKEEGFVWVQVKAYRTDDFEENGSDAEELGDDSLGGIDAASWREVAVMYSILDNALTDARDAWNARLENAARQMEESRADMYIRAQMKV